MSHSSPPEPIMFQDANLEEGTVKQVSMKVKDDRNSISSVEMKGIGSTRESRILLYGTVRKWMQYTTSRAAKYRILRWYMSDMAFFSWFVYALIVDTLFLYTPVINDDKKCFKADKSLWIAAICVRSYMDFLHLLLTIGKLRIGSNGKYSWRSMLLFFIIHMSIILPLPQVLVILAATQRISATKFFFAMNFFLGQHLIKVIRMITIYQKITTSGDTLTGWARFSFNLSYFQAANGIGAIWYFFAAERKITCWRKTCIGPSGCDHLSFYCNNSSRNYKFNNSCSTKTENMTTYDFGLFYDAIDSGVVEQSNFLKRFLPSIRWSLQSISSFGQGLPFSDNVLENLFVIFIIISSVVLFFFLIAKAQFEMSILEERRQKVKEISRWQPFRKLPTNLRNEVNRYQASKWRETRGVDIEQFINILPHHLRLVIKRKLCLDLLKKVEEFGEWNDELLKDLCDLAKPVHFPELSYTVREGDTIDQMLFVLEGELWFYSSRVNEGRNGKKNYSEDGDYCGEELVAWAQADSDSSILPVSTKTIQALTNVEAFVLTADDLNKGIQRINVKRNWAARRIQLFWRSTRNTRTSTI